MPALKCKFVNDETGRGCRSRSTLTEDPDYCWFHTKDPEISFIRTQVRKETARTTNEKIRVRRIVHGKEEKRLCIAKTNTNRPCRNPAVQETLFCSIKSHKAQDPETPEERADLMEWHQMSIAEEEAREKDTISNDCAGVIAGGVRRCKKQASLNGYCLTHQWQFESGKIQDNHIAIHNETFNKGKRGVRIVDQPKDIQDGRTVIEQLFADVSMIALNHVDVNVKIRAARQASDLFKTILESERTLPKLRDDVESFVVETEDPIESGVVVKQSDYDDIDSIG